jgi:hydrogenase-4 component B
VPLNLAIAAILLAAASGLPSLAFPRGSPVGQRVSACLLVLACAAGTAGALMGIFEPPSAALGLAWAAVGGSLIGLDPLGAFFLVPIFAVGGLSAIYGLGYRPQARNRRTGTRLSIFFGLLIAGMGLLVLARHALAFLLGWEAMALSAFFLVGVEDERGEARKAALIYIIATHVGTLALFGLFSLWRSATGGFGLDPAAAAIGPAATNGLMLLSLLAFGLKAGAMPLHFWLPGAHAAAPSQVSAMLSGVVLKMGIYGLLRMAFLLPRIPPFWGGLVLALGAASGLLGVAFALAQHDIKRLLAYHSVENVGIILMGLGLALLGRSLARPELLALGLAGCLLHVWNHSFFKSLLFLGAGSVVRATGTRQIDRLGGLAKAMPWTAAFFLAGAVAICGLPPLNGFVSELLVYLGLFSALGSGPGGAVMAAPVLAMIGALALACFVKAYGAAFLGFARSPETARAKESPASMLVPMAVLCALCALIGLAPALLVPALDSVVSGLCRMSGLDSPPSLGSLAPLGAAGAASAALLGVAALIGLPLARAARRAGRAATWDCGYARPTPRMQYSASSFARGIVRMFSWALRPPEEPPRLEGAFPAPASLRGEVDEAVLDRALMPALRGMERLSRWLRRFQAGLSQQYILYILIALGLMSLTLIPFDRILALLAGP